MQLYISDVDNIRTKCGKYFNNWQQKVIYPIQSPINIGFVKLTVTN